MTHRKHFAAAAALSLTITASAQEVAPSPLGSSAGVDVTFVDHVGPLVHQACASCHRPGQAAPFSLLTYHDVAKRSGMILDVVEDGYMPPWPPSSDHLPFEGERRLDEAQVQLLREWIDAGKPRGEGELAPPEFPSEWALGEPDVVVEMAHAFVVPASGPDVYRSFVLPLALEEDRWVRAIELRPTAPQVVHHALFFSAESESVRRVDREDATIGFEGMRGEIHGGLGGYVPGAGPQTLPEGLAFHLPKGSDLLVQTHFHPTGKVEHECSRVGIYFDDGPPHATIERIAVPALFGIGERISIPAGEAKYLVRSTVEIPVDVSAHVVAGHAHYLCSEMELHARLPNGSSLTLLAIDDWDIDWQGQYRFAEAVDLPAGTELVAEFVFDNSAENPDNPYSPPRDVHWGRQTHDEMASLSLLVTAEDRRGADRIRSLAQQMQRDAIQAFLQGPSESVHRVLDRNGDGRVEKDEMPRGGRGFRLLDRDRDGSLSVDELRHRFGGAANTPQRVEPTHGPSAPDVEGVARAPFSAGWDRAAVAVFVTADCPIANQYLPELRDIAAEYEARGVRFTLVQVDPTLDAGRAIEHAEAYGVRVPVLVDRTHELVRGAGVTMTPEVAVFGHDGTLKYRGRIDDRFPRLGDRRVEPLRRDLRIALDELLTGCEVSVPRTEVVGCPVPEELEPGR